MSKMDPEVLVCYGCAHSASSQPYPGCPSGERPCGSCIRAHKHERFFTASEGDRDNYIPLDRLYSSCDVCDGDEKRIGGHMCMECARFVRDAANEPI